jgi:hypothetical protein
MRNRLGECCCCIPLRQGVAAIAGVTILLSLLAVLGLFFSFETVLLTSGGFSPVAKVVCGIVGASGFVFGAIGLLGAYDQTQAYIRALWYFLIAQVTLSIAVYAIDMVELHGCETWTSTVQQHTEYNPVMDEVAQAGQCSKTRVEYSIAWLIMFMVRCYFIFEVWKYYKSLDMHQHYTINFEKESRFPSVFVASGAEGQGPPMSATPQSGYGSFEQVPTPQRSYVTRTAPPAYVANGGQNGR